MIMNKVRVQALIILIFAIFLPLVLINAYESQQSLSVVKTDSLSGSNQFPGPGDSMSDTPWVRENVFINANIYLQQGFGYQLNNFHDTALNENSKSYKIVMFGDSYTWGNGNVDWANNIGNELERELNRETESNIFEVVTRARNGRSIYNHYDFFRAFSLNDLNPQMVIYNYYVNDAIPSYTEELICGQRVASACSADNPLIDPSYRACLRGKGSFPAELINRLRNQYPLTTQNILTRYCDPKLKKAQAIKYNYEDVLLNPPASPYYSTWLEALPLLQQEVAPYSIHVANLYASAGHKEANKILLQDMKNAGYGIIPMTNTTKTIGEEILPREKEDQLVKKLWVNPGNTHASSYLIRQYVLDIAKYVKENLNEEKYLSAKKNSSPLQPAKLVTHTMPTFAIEVESKDSKNANLFFDKDSKPLYPQSIVEGEKMPFQYANCLNLGYSNFQFMLAKGTKGKLRIQGLDSKNKTNLGFYIYDDQHSRRYLSVKEGKLNTMVVDIPSSFGSPTLVIGFPDYGKGCPINKVIDAPDFNVSLALL